MDSSRTDLIIGKNNTEKLKKSNILIVGLGGVGGSAFEMLIRSGVQNFTIVDGDVVEPSNLNRQTLFTSNDVGKPKVEVAQELALAINPGIRINAMHERIDMNSIPELTEFDYVVDAIDDTLAKAHLVINAFSVKTPIISCLSMGNRMDQTLIRSTKLNKTCNDPMARIFRHDLRRAGIPLKDVNVVFSEEEPVISGKIIGSTYLCPNYAGMLMAKHVVQYILEEKQNGKNN